MKNSSKRHGMIKVWTDAAEAGLLDRHGLDPQRFAGDDKPAIDMEDL